MKTGRRDGKESHVTMVEEFIPNHNDSISLVLSRFQAIGVDVEATVALLGTTVHSNIYGHEHQTPHGHRHADTTDNLKKKIT